MWTLLGLVAGFLVLVGLVSYALIRLLASYLDRQIALASRSIAVEERQVALEESKAKGPTLPPPMPPDLVRRVTRWQDKDAQDNERKVLLDLFAETDSWDGVRALLPKEYDEQPKSELYS